MALRERDDWDVKEPAPPNGEKLIKSFEIARFSRIMYSFIFIAAMTFCITAINRCMGMPLNDIMTKFHAVSVIFSTFDCECEFVIYFFIYLLLLEGLFILILNHQIYESKLDFLKTCRHCNWLTSILS